MTASSHLPVLDDELLGRLDQPGPRYTSYPTAPEWTSTFGPEEYAQALETAAERPDEPLSIYVHIPFCQELCSYCGCNVIVSRDPRRRERYLDALALDVKLAAERLGHRRKVSRLHLGGGTPTSLDEAQLERLHAILAGAFEPLPDAELAVEIDPVVTTPGQLALLRRLGWNRLSMGVQDLDPEVQRAVNRVQSEELTRDTIQRARDLGYTSVNVDLIYGLPRQTPDSWRRTIDKIVALRPDRMAVFSFAFLPSVKPHQKRLAAYDVPSGRRKLELFRIAHDGFVDAGWRSIGFDHFALPDDELSIAADEGTLWRDFQGYTTARAAETVAFGMSGISFVGGAWAQIHKGLGEWYGSLSRGVLPVERGHVLSEDDKRRRNVILELLCNFRVDLGAEGARLFAAELDALRPLEADGLVNVKGTVIEATPLGRLFARNIAMVFDAYLRRKAGAERPVYSRTV